MIKVGYLVSYDYKMLLTSIEQLYVFADKIYLAIDKERKTWSGNSFEIPESFFSELQEYDTKNKIEFYYDNFYKPELTPMQCDTRERNMLAKKMGKGWLLQVDVDEYIYDFKNLANYLRKYWFLTIFPRLTPIVLRGKLVTLFRQVENGYLYIENNEYFSFITNIPEYSICRSNIKSVNFFTNTNVIHQSWARTDDEIQQKIKNWGHRDDFDTQKYFEYWKSLNSENYKNYKNIHPIAPQVWDKLHFLSATSIDDFIIKYSDKNEQKLVPLGFKIMLKTIFYKSYWWLKSKKK